MLLGPIGGVLYHNGGEGGYSAPSLKQQRENPAWERGQEVDSQSSQGRGHMSKQTSIQLLKSVSIQTPAEKKCVNA